MAQITPKFQYRFRIIGPGNDKRLRSWLFHHKHSHTRRTDLDYDCAIFYAPEDHTIVMPLLYGAKAIDGRKMNLSLDRTWIREYRELPKNFPKVGIGRGAHFLNVMSGGALWQEVRGHAEGKLCHDIKDPNGELRVAPSNHTISMIHGNDALVLGQANASTMLADDTCVFNEIDEWGDDEIIYYEHNRSLCLEPDPSVLGYKQFSDFAMKLIETSCNPSL